MSENEYIAVNIDGKLVDSDYFEREDGVSRERLNLDDQSIQIIDDLEGDLAGEGMDKGRSRSVRVALKTLAVVKEENPDFLSAMIERTDNL